MFWYFFQDLNIRFYLAQRIVWPTLFLPLMDLKGAFSPNKNTNPTKGLSTPNLVQNTRELIPNVFNKDLKKKHQRLHLLKVVQNIVWYSIVKQVVVLWVSFLKQKHTHTHTSPTVPRVFIVARPVGSSHLKVLSKFTLNTSPKHSPVEDFRGKSVHVFKDHVGMEHICVFF